MRRLILLLLLLSGTQAYSQTSSQLNASRITLPNGWQLTPAGKSLALGDLPLNMAVSKNGKLIAVTNNGQSTQTLQLIDAKANRTISEVIIAKSWYGLKFSDNAKELYASAGNDDQVKKYNIINGKLILGDSFLLGEKPKTLVSPSGLELDEAAGKLYVVTKENNSLYTFNLKSKELLSKVKLPGEAYTCLLSPNKKTLFISCWGCDKVLLYNVAAGSISGEINVGDNPNEMLLSPNGKLLYVANANDNSVSIIDIAAGKVIETLNAALFPNAPSGSTTNGVALSTNAKMLYVANADNNCLAVFDVRKSAASVSKGFIPVGWYPTNVKVVGKNIYVSNGKGFQSMANPQGPNPVKKREAVVYQQGDSNKIITVQYIAGLFKGTLSIIPEPNAAQLNIYSQAVYKNSPYTKLKDSVSEGMAGNPIPMKVGDPSPVKHVFYIIKENRTYDQVLGDMPAGNGDTSLVLFGKNITPNQHKLAQEFVLLDNFYVDAEVSADGHNWSMGAYANDYLEKTWPTNYGGRGGRYDAEGNRAIANNKPGFIWDICAKNNVSYRSYGEFADKPDGNIPALKNHVANNFAGYNMSVKDTTRFQQWKKDFDSLYAINKIPQFNTIRFGNDHTEGLRLGRPTPYAHVADNDYAVGLFLEHLSSKPIWANSVVFILEDDAQNGADHVDAHRSTAYLAGGFVKRNFVDHTMYTTSGFLRTMELILGLPPMSQYDAAATPLWRCFTPVQNNTPFTAISPLVNLAEKNVAVNKWQKLSDSFSFVKEDDVPDLLFNELLWYAVKGEGVAFPGPRRAAFVKPAIKDKDDD